ncbi:MAG: TetR/AcrR family transcriptional regulator [Lachnospiraceae bacterium]|nr:TetR/AcrR family transcriptional regulator [Lachnospiraceae bacterium]
MKTTKTRREDRRTTYTKNVIKDAMLELLSEEPFEKITVAALCRRAEIVRTTFYLHYDGLTDVLKELADDAILAVSEGSSYDFDNISLVAKEMRKTTDPDLLASCMNLLPVCQRVFDDPKYRPMFKDYMVSSYILKELYRQEVGGYVETMVREYGLSKKQAEKIFLFGITGAFEVNKSMNWEKNQDWYEVQKALLTFTSGGYEALRKMNSQKDKK